MGQQVEVKVPDIGDFKEVEVIEVLVKPGDTVAKEQSLITVESDKASMEIPSSAAGVVKELKIKLGDKVSEGTLLLVLDAAAGASAPAAAAGRAAPRRRHRRRRQRRRPLRRRARRRLPRPLRRRTSAPAVVERAGDFHTEMGARPAPIDLGAPGAQAACVAVGAQVRARTRRRPAARGGQRAEGPHHAGRRARAREGRDGGRRAPARPRLPRPRRRAPG